jgi:hypothetical protein
MIEWSGMRALAGTRAAFDDRVLATLLFTDLVDSTTKLVTCRERWMGLGGCLGSGPCYWFGNGRVLTWPAWSTLTSINSLPRRRTAESALWLSSAQP